MKRHLLAARLKGRQTLSQRQPTGRKLDQYQEQAVVQWVFQLDALDLSPTPEMIRDCANSILMRNAASARIGHTILYNAHSEATLN